jgi:hypothetical protein
MSDAATTLPRIGNQGEPSAGTAFFQLDAQTTA